MDQIPFPPGPILAAVDFSQGALAARERLEAAAGGLGLYDLVVIGV